MSGARLNGLVGWIAIGLTALGMLAAGYGAHVAQGEQVKNNREAIERHEKAIEQTREAVERYSREAAGMKSELEAIHRNQERILQAVEGRHGP